MQNIYMVIVWGVLVRIWETILGNNTLDKTSTTMHPSCDNACKEHRTFHALVFFLPTVKPNYFVYFSGQLEVFHNALLKYCPKRLHFQYRAMKACTMLAIMDHNENHSTDREQATTSAGGY